MLFMSQRGIDSIFKKDPEGRYYSNKACLYQDILIFGSTIGEGKPFKLRELAKYLLDNNEEIRNYYRGKKLTNSNRTENIQKRIQRSIEGMISMRLMKEGEKVKEDKGSGMIPTYTYTPTGYLICQIIRCVIYGKENAEEQLYTLFHKRLSKDDANSPSLLVFNSKFMENIHDKNLFGNYVSVFQKALDSKEITDIESFVRLIQHFISPLFQRKHFVRVWKETIDELDPQTRQLYMYEQKLAIDYKMGSKALSREYEVKRLELRENVEEVALEGICNVCHRRYVFPMKIIEYTFRLAYIDRLPSPIHCPECKKYERTIPIQLPIL
jgi:hypothetical protein